jgi:hypothetical protein
MVGKRLSVGVAACLVVSGLAVSAHAQVQSPWVSTDRTVDCSSYQTIVRDVLKPGMTDEQKAIALYDFFRQRVYHYLNMPESRQPLKCINILGNTLCGSQATCMKGLLEAAGIKARVVSHPGHTFYEAFYGGQWHNFDTMTNFYVFTRGDKPHVASCEELNKDPSLIKDAVKEGRACPGMVPCGDDAMAFAEKIEETGYEPDRSAWSVKDYALRPGEEIVRSWWPHGKPMPESMNAGDPGPLHGCGGRDRGNPPELFRFWEPYAILGFGSPAISFRHYCNGWMTYSPDLSAGALKDSLAKGELTIPVKCPFYITAATVAFEATCPGEGDRVEVSVVSKKQTTPITTAGDSGKKVYTAELDKAVVTPQVGQHEYALKFKLTGKATLNNLCLRTIFVHNAMAAPHLMPGENKVTFTAGDPDALKAAPVTIIYRYKDAPDYKDLKTVEQTAKASPFTFAAKLPQTPKLPQMQDLTLRCGMLHWDADKVPTPQRVVGKVSAR